MNDTKAVRIGSIYGFGTGYAGNVWDANAVSPTVRTPSGGGNIPTFQIKGGVVMANATTKMRDKRFRRLTPLEAYRLMAQPDDAFYRAKYGRDFPYEIKLKQHARTCTKEEWKRLYRYLRHPVMADTQLYQQAGNSICVNVLVAIFGQMFEGHENDYKLLYFDRYEMEGERI